MPQTPASVFTAIFPGHVIVGASLSITVTLKVQDEVPIGFVAVAVTVVVPIGKRLPEGGE